MNLVSYLFATFLGIILAVHLAMNGEVGNVLKNPRVANALFWCIGALTALIIGFGGWQPGFRERRKGVHPVLLLAGAMGACLVFAIAWLLPQVGARAVFITLIAGQVFGGMVLSQFGWLGSPIQPVSVLIAVGAAGMALDVVPPTYTK
jgi:transporter family-2 protein